MQELNKHINNITLVKNDIIKFACFLDSNQYNKFHTYLEEKYSSYISSFKSIFEPNKEIKEDMIYFTDIRSLSKYNEDIISGWLIEDFFIFIFKLEIFKTHHFSVTLDNHDADRVIKKERTYINSQPDFTITNKGTTFKVEVQSLLIDYHKFHIKENKANKLLYNNSFLLCFLLKEENIVFFYPNNIKKYGKLTSIKAFGGKKGYEYIIAKLPKNKFINKNNFLKKLVIIFYWFFYNVKLKNNFNQFCQNSIHNYKTIDSLLDYLKKENT